MVRFVTYFYFSIIIISSVINCKQVIQVLQPANITAGFEFNENNDHHILVVFYRGPCSRCDREALNIIALATYLNGNGKESLYFQLTAIYFQIYVREEAGKSYF